MGVVIDEQTGRARLDGVDGFLQVLANPILWTTVVHVISSAFLVAGAVVIPAGISPSAFARSFSSSISCLLYRLFGMKYMQNRITAAQLN